MAKYDLLTEFLIKIPLEINKISLNIEEIENILLFPLPESSKKKIFWVNDRSFSKAQSVSWISAGWVVESFDLENSVIIFKRDDNEEFYFL